MFWFDFGELFVRDFETSNFGYYLLFLNKFVTWITSIYIETMTHASYKNLKSYHKFIYTFINITSYSILPQ